MGNLKMNNMEIVNRALKTIMVPLQDYVISEMKFKYGEKWWKKGVVDEKALYLSIDAPRGDIEDDVARSYLDVPNCMSLIFHYKMINTDALKKGAKDQLQYVKDLRVHLYHNGETDYKYLEAQDAIRTMMILDEMMMLDCQEDLQYLYDNLIDNRQKKKKETGITNKTSKKEDDKSNAPVPSTATSGTKIDLKTLAIMSCKGMIEQLTEKQQRDKYDTSRTIINIDGWVPKEGGFKLKIDKEIFNTDSLGLMIDGVEYIDSRVLFDNYNRYTKTIMMFITENENPQSLIEEHTIQLFSDMKWLVSRTLSFFEQYGDLLTYPASYSSFAVGTTLIDIGLDESNEQDKAVSMSLSKPLSYVWGVPGSGKTQAVLARAINESVKRGERVAVIAPTNNALEQVIRGLIKAFNNSSQDRSVIDPSKDIIRIGTPTSEFMKDFSSMCEPKGIQVQLQRKISSLSFLLNLRSERAYERCKEDVEQLVKKAENVKDEEQAQLQFFQSMKPILDLMKDNQRYSVNAKTTNHKNAVKNIKRIYDLIYGHDRTNYFEDELIELSDDEIDKRIIKHKEEIDNIRLNHPNSDITTAKVIAMTLSKFIISFGPYNSNYRTQLNVDRIFVDEAGYCNDIQTLSLLSLGKPVTMLGDHMQLPPVCEIERKDLLYGIEMKDEHRYDFFWDLSALYVDHFFDENYDSITNMYCDYKDPDFPYTSRQELTKSYRFGPNLARILGKHVYDMEITSNSEEPLKIEVIDAKPVPFPIEYGKVKRKNVKEALAVLDYIENNIDKGESYIILTPYTDQVRCLKSKCKMLEENILTIHKSQGREWDTVIISVCDCSENPIDKIPRFTSTRLVEEGATPGIKVLNTAISRAKKKLVIVCDIEHWKKQDGELLAELIQIE